MEHCSLGAKQQLLMMKCYKLYTLVSGLIRTDFVLESSTSNGVRG